MVDAIGEPELADRSGAVAATHHGETATVGDRAGDRSGAGREGLELEDAHWAVPEHGRRAGDGVRVVTRGLGPDVQTLESIRDGAGAHVSRRRGRRHLRGRDDIGRYLDASRAQQRAAVLDL